MFPVKNGVGQEAVSSPSLFSIYILHRWPDTELRASGLGCRLAMFFYGFTVWPPTHSRIFLIYMELGQQSLEPFNLILYIGEFIKLLQEY